MADLKYRPIGARAFERAVQRDLGMESLNFSLDIDRAVFAALGDKPDEILKVRFAGEESLGQLQQFQHLSVPGGDLMVTVEHQHAVSHIVEGHAQDGAALLQLGGAFLDDFLEAGSRLLAFGQELIERDSIVAEHTDGVSHFGDLIAAGVLDADVQIAFRDAPHAVAEQVQPPHHAAPDVEPS